MTSVPGVSASHPTALDCIRACSIMRIASHDPAQATEVGGHIHSLDCAEKLLAAFSGPWHVKLQRLPPTPDMAGAALQPILVKVQRADLAHADELAPVELCFSEDLSAPNAEQLQDICQVCMSPSPLLHESACSWH